MTTGERKHFVTIQQASITQSASGDETIDWESPVSIGTRFCSLVPKDSKQFPLRADQVLTETQFAAVMDGYMAVNTTMRVKHDDGRVFDIVGISAADGQAPANAAWLTLQLVEGVRRES